jgi:RNA polymerase sigma-70 factor (ECF subfamily)
LSKAALEREQQVLVRSVEGDESAFEEIVRGHQGMVFSMAYHFLRNRPLAEELAQEVFLSLYQNLATIKSPAHLVFWLRKVTSHRCLDQARRQKHRAHLSLDDVPEPQAEIKTTDGLLSENLNRLVTSLPEKQRMVIVLRYQEDLDPSEIAELLKMPVNTVKSHLRRSLAILREKLGSVLGKYTYEEPR